MAPERRFKSVNVFGKIFFTLFFITTNLGLYAQIVSYSNDFLNIGATAQGIGMGNSMVASAHDASAVYYNPANITKISNTFDFAITHSEYFGSIANYDFLLFAYKYNEKTYLGFGLLRMGIDNIPNTLNIYNNGSFNLDNITYFSVEDYAMFLVFARKSAKLSYAIRSKLVYRHLGSFVNGYGFGLDACLAYQWRDFHFGVNINDALGTFTAWFYNLDQQTIDILDSTGNEIPHNTVEIAVPSTTLGVSRDLKINGKLTLRSELDLFIQWAQRTSALISTPVASLSPGLGTEFIFKDVLFIRAGLYNFQKITYFSNNTSVNFTSKINFFPSLGIGFRYHKVIIDYTFQNLFNQAVPLQSHFITVRFPLNSHFWSKKQD